MYPIKLSFVWDNGPGLKADVVLSMDVNQVPKFQEAIRIIDRPTSANSVYFCTNEQDMRRIQEARYTVAKVISDQCYRFVMQQLESRDLRDGYPIETKKQSPSSETPKPS